MAIDSNFCMDALNYTPVDHVIFGTSHINIFMMTAGAINLVMSILTVIWIKNKEREAAEEISTSDQAAKSVIFPVFVQVLWLLVISSIYTAIVSSTIHFDPLYSNPPVVAGLYAVIEATKHGLIEGIAFLFMKKGCGIYAAKRALKRAVLWGLIIFVSEYYVFRTGDIGGDVVELILQFIGVSFYGVLAYAPYSLVYRRPACIGYAKFWFWYIVCMICVSILFFDRSTYNIAACSYMSLEILLVSLMSPLIVYWTFLQDSRWWQGLDYNINPKSDNNNNNSFMITSGTNYSNKSRFFNNSYEEIRAPLLGSDISLFHAQSLAATLDNMRARGRVKMLNFARLKVDFKKALGAGSFSKVYKGEYAKAIVAIKLIYTNDITMDVIQRIAAEVLPRKIFYIADELLTKLLCNSVCLVLELCFFGSLSDIIRGYGFDWSTSQRFPLALTRADLLFLALGCARGLAAIHALDENLCHRDIKSFNYLVDHHFVVKLADLELGVTNKSEDSNLKQSGSVGRKSTFMGSVVKEEHPFSIDRDNNNYVEVDDLLVNWLAPEVLVERMFCQASDVYSLGTVLWEIFAQQLPYEHESQLQIRAKLKQKYIEKLHKTISVEALQEESHQETNDNGLVIPEDEKDSTIGKLIARCWNFNKRQRPTASTVAAVLENELSSLLSVTIQSQKHSHGGNNRLNLGIMPTYQPQLNLVYEYYHARYRISKQSKHSSRFYNNSITSSNTRHNAKIKAAHSHNQINHINNSNSYSFSQSFLGNDEHSTITMAEHQRSSSFYSKIGNYLTGNSYNNSTIGAVTGRNTSVNTQSSGNAGNGDTTEQSQQFYPDINQPNTFKYDNESRVDEQKLLSSSTFTKILKPVFHSLADPALSIETVPTAVIDALQPIKGEYYWKALEGSGQAWVAVSAEEPHIVLHATSTWYTMFNIAASFGRDFQLISLQSLLAPSLLAHDDKTSASNSYVQHFTNQDSHLYYSNSNSGKSNKKRRRRNTPTFQEKKRGFMSLFSSQKSDKILANSRKPSKNTYNSSNSFTRLRCLTTHRLLRALKQQQEFHGMICIHLPSIQIHPIPSNHNINNSPKPKTTKLSSGLKNVNSESSERDEDYGIKSHGNEGGRNSVYYTSAQANLSKEVHLGSESSYDSAHYLNALASSTSTYKVSGHNMMSTVHVYPIHTPSYYQYHSQRNITGNNSGNLSSVSKNDDKVVSNSTTNNVVSSDAQKNVQRSADILIQNKNNDDVQIQRTPTENGILHEAAYFSLYSSSNNSNNIQTAVHDAGMNINQNKNNDSLHSRNSQLSPIHKPVDISTSPLSSSSSLVKHALQLPSVQQEVGSMPNTSTMTLRRNTNSFKDVRLFSNDFANSNSSGNSSNSNSSLLDADALSKKQILDDANINNTNSSINQQNITKGAMKSSSLSSSFLLSSPLSYLRKSESASNQQNVTNHSNTNNVNTEHSNNNQNSNSTPPSSAPMYYLIQFNELLEQQPAHYHLHGNNSTYNTPLHPAYPSSNYHSTNSSKSNTSTNKKAKSESQSKSNHSHSSNNLLAFASMLFTNHDHSSNNNSSSASNNYTKLSTGPANTRYAIHRMQNADDDDDDEDEEDDDGSDEQNSESSENSDYFVKINDDDNLSNTNHENSYSYRYNYNTSVSYSDSNDQTHANTNSNQVNPSLTHQQNIVQAILGPLYKSSNSSDQVRRGDQDKVVYHKRERGDSNLSLISAGSGLAKSPGPLDLSNSMGKHENPMHSVSNLPVDHETRDNSLEQL